MDNPFLDLIPNKPQSASAKSMAAVSEENDNPFAELIPKKPKVQQEVIPTPASTLPSLPGAAGLIQYLLGTNLKKSAQTLASDVGQSLYNLPKEAINQIGKIPQYSDYLQKNVPQALNLIQEDPTSAAKSALGGVGEFLGKVSRIPPNAVDYLSHLGLVSPQTAQNFPQPFSEQEVKEYIDRQLGEEKPGSDLIRGLFRNLDKAYLGTKAAQSLNPASFTNKALANEVVKEGERQYKSHQKLYHELFKDAEAFGINDVNVNKNELKKLLKPIKNTEIEESWSSLKNLIDNPTLPNAQAAQSSLSQLKRKYSIEAKKRALNDKEKAVYEAAKRGEKYIEDKMFKDKQGNTIHGLKDRYNKITESYRENVVPYKYNPNVIEYKDRKKTAKELLQSLQRGEFAVKKLSKHPKIVLKNLLPHLVAPTAAGSVLGYLFGKGRGNDNI